MTVADVYATASDVTGWLAPDSPPANADKLRRGATFVIAEAANRNPYADTPSGGDVAALRDAVCAQVASWVALGIDPDDLGVVEAAPVKKASINGADVEYDTSAQTKARASAARDLAPQAEAILTAAGLLWVPMPLSDPTGGALRHYGISGPGFDRFALRPDLDFASDWPFQ